MLLPDSRSPNLSTPVIPGADPAPYWTTDNVAAVLENGLLLLQSGQIARRSGTAEVRVGTSVITGPSAEGGLIAHQHAVRRADFPPPMVGVVPGGLEGLILGTRAGVRELWFTDGAQATQIKFPIANGRAAQFIAATSVTTPIWGQRDDSFFLILDQALPTEKTWIVTLNRPATGGAMKKPVAVKKIVELTTTLGSGDPPTWFATADGVPVQVFNGALSNQPYLDATNHLILSVSWRPLVGADSPGFGALLDLMSQTVVLTVAGATFGPPTFGGSSGSAVSLTILHLDRPAPARSRIVAEVVGEGFDTEPFPGPFFHSQEGLSVIDGTGAIVRNALVPFGGGGLSGLFAATRTRRHVIHSTGIVGSISMTDAYSGQTVVLGVPATADPKVTFIRPDFALRLATPATPHFVNWWDKKTGAIRLANPLTDPMLQTEDAELTKKKKLTAPLAAFGASSYAYHVVEGSRVFPYKADAKNP